MQKIKERSYEEYALNIGDMTVSFFAKDKDIFDTARSSSTKHKHEFCELFYIAKGRVDVETTDNVYTLTENDVALIPCKIPHKSIVADGTQRMVIAFACTKNKNRTTEFCYEKFKFLTEEGEVRLFKDFPAADSFRRFARYHYGDYKEKRHLILSCLYEILFFVKEFAAEGTSATAQALPDSDLYRNYMIDVYLSEKYADGNLEDLSRVLYLSRQQTHRVITGLYGKSFGECLNEVKMQKAVQMMENTDLSFAEIGTRVGYKNPNSFFTAFKKHYGMTPRSYKEKLIGYAPENFR